VEPHVVVSGTQVGGVVDVTVTDNGIGIPVGMREQVFQRFEQVPGTGLGGTGMGLSICRTIVQRHGGEITVGDGPDGVGSSFRVRLPSAG
jgi:signal transduction histidine kinase